MEKENNNMSFPDLEIGWSDVRKAAEQIISEHPKLSALALAGLTIAASPDPNTAKFWDFDIKNITPLQWLCGAVGAGVTMGWELIDAGSVEKTILVKAQDGKMYKASGAHQTIEYIWNAGCGGVGGIFIGDLIASTQTLRVAAEIFGVLVCFKLAKLTKEGHRLPKA